MRILIAEDDQFMRHLMDELTRALGHETLVAPDGEGALRLFESGAPDIILLDWEIPAPDGLEVCRRIRAHERGALVYILMVTARDATEHLDRVLDAGADDYVSKPISADGLRARLTIAERWIAQNAARRQAEAALARAQWLAGIGEMSLAVQHEINNPLAALLGNAALIESGLSAPSEERKILQVVVEQAHRIAGVVKRLSALKEPQSIEYLRGTRMIDLSADTPPPAGKDRP